MPRMDGRECLAALKQDVDLRDIPVVILTTSEVERDVVASYHLGAAGYVTKSVDMLQFMATIRGLGNYWIDLVRLPHPSQ
jgi:CheY-like chemotaxis protein